MMAKRTEIVRELLDRAVGELGRTDWAIAGGNRLRAKLGDDVEGVILPLAAGYVSYTVSIMIGPRFPSVERLVTKASRAAGQPEAGIRTSAIFPTVFERLSSLSSVPDNAPLGDLAVFTDALCAYAVPFINRLSTIGAAADFALHNSLAYGSHALRIPVLLAKAGRRQEAQSYLNQQAEAGAPYSAFMTRYRDAVTAIL